MTRKRDTKEKVHHPSIPKSKEKFSTTEDAHRSKPKPRSREAHSRETHASPEDAHRSKPAVKSRSREAIATPVKSRSREAIATPTKNSKKKESVDMACIAIEKSSKAGGKSRSVGKKSRGHRSTGRNQEPTVDTMEFIKHINKVGWDGVEKEHDGVKSYIEQTIYQYTGFSKNPNKNRYHDIVCLDNTRFILQTGVPPLSDYIHANTVKIPGNSRQYIATQAPMESTSEDFWRLVYDANSPVIICLQEMDLSRDRAYFPIKVDTYINYGSMQVSNKKVESIDGMYCGTFEVVAEGCSNSVVTRLIQTNEYPDGWQSSLILKERRTATQLLRAFDKYDRGTAIVHCSAGIGRTCTFIMVDSVLTKLRNKHAVDIPAMMKQLRSQRAAAIQNATQYLLVYVLALEYLREKQEPAIVAAANHLLDSYQEYAKRRLND